jgi:hypothetical protein
MLEPLRIIAKSTAYNAQTTACNAECTAVYCTITPAMAFHKRKPKMKDDHIAYLPVYKAGIACRPESSALW